MFLTKLKVTAAALLLIATGSAVLVSQATAAKGRRTSGNCRRSYLVMPGGQPDRDN